MKCACGHSGGVHVHVGWCRTPGCKCIGLGERVWAATYVREDRVWCCDTGHTSLTDADRCGREIFGSLDFTIRSRD